MRKLWYGIAAAADRLRVILAQINAYRKVDIADSLRRIADAFGYAEIRFVFSPGSLLVDAPLFLLLRARYGRLAACTRRELTRQTPDGRAVYLFSLRKPAPQAAAGERLLPYITLFDLLVLPDNPDALPQHIPLLINTLENCYSSIGVVGDNPYAERIGAYLAANPNLTVRRLSIADVACEAGAYTPDTRGGVCELYLFIDMLAPLPLRFPDAETAGFSPQALFWRTVLHGVLNRPYKDIRHNILPALRDAGIPVLYVEEPDTERFDDAAKRGMRRFLSLLQRDGNAYLEAVYRLFGTEELIPEHRRKRATKAKGYPEIYSESGRFSYDAGFRKTPGNPVVYERTVYVFGACVVTGIFVADEDTVTAYLRALLPETWRVLNRGTASDIGLNLVLRRTVFQPGDIAIVFADRPTDSLPYPTLDLTDSYLAVPQLYRHIADMPYHCDAAVNRRIAEDLCAALSAVDLLTDPAADAEPVRFGGAVRRVPETDMLGNPELKTWLDALAPYEKPGKNGAIVMNCNPFTRGHRYLIEWAAGQVENLYVFVVEEDRSFFPYADRLRLVREGAADLGNVTVLPGGRFIISSTTLPGYFEKASLGDVPLDATLDLEIFASIARRLRIDVRFAGHEPLDAFTRQYNENMRAILPLYGISFVEIERVESGGGVISASRVRKCLAEKDFAAIEPLVPAHVLRYLKEKYAG